MVAEDKVARSGELLAEKRARAQRFADEYEREKKELSQVE